MQLGGVVLFHLREWAEVSEYKHMAGIKQFGANQLGTRVVFLDNKDELYYLNPVRLRAPLHSLRSRSLCSLKSTH